MRKNRKIIIHIGYPKTATSYLQKVLFPLLSSTKVINFIPHFLIKSELYEIMHHNENSFDADSVKKRISTHFSDSINVISYEGLSGSVFFKSYNSNIIASRLAKIFPDATIIIMLRNQGDLIYSLYKQFIQEGGVLSFVEFTNQGLKETQEFDDHKLELSSFKYSYILKTYHSKFNKVEVLTFEEMIEDFNSFIKRLLSALSIKMTNNYSSNISFEKKIINRSYGRNQIRIAKFLNRLTYSHLNRYGFFAKIAFALGFNTFLLRRILQSKISFSILGNLPIKNHTSIKFLNNYYNIDNCKINDYYALKLNSKYFSK